MAFKKANKLIIATAAMAMIISSLGINPKANLANAADSDRPNVILLIGDGMSTSATTFARWYKDAQNGKYGDDKLNIDDYLTGYVKTSWAKGPITDSAPGGTAFATGQKTNDKYVGSDINGNPLATVLEAAELEGMATGLIATSEMTHATPSDFSAHVTDRGNYNAIVKQQMKSGVDVVLGGGIGSVSKYFDTKNDPEAQTKYNEYLKNLQNALTEEGYDIVTTKEELTNSNSDKVWGIFAEADLAYDFDRVAFEEKYNTQPSLSQMTKTAIEKLEKDEDGFFLMVEGSKVDWAAHANDPAGIASDILAYDEAVKEAIDYAKADGNTIVISTSDHGNSGIIYGNENTSSTYDSLTFEQTVAISAKAKVSLETLNNMIKGKSNEEILTIADEYYGLDSLTTEELAKVKEGKANEVLSNRANIGFTTGGHTGGDVGLYVYAPSHLEELNGIVHNTDIAKYIEKSMKVDLEKTQNTLFVNLKTELEKIGATITIAEPKTSATKETPTLVAAKNGHTMEIEAYANSVTIDNKKVSISTPTTINNTAFFGNIEIVNKFKEASASTGGGNNGGGGTITPSPSEEIKDIENHWAKDAIQRFIDKGYINGYGDNTFKPENNITRAEFVKIVNKLYGYTDKADIKFSDTNSNEWYYDEVRIGVQAGYIDGYEDNTFRPNDSITREEASKIIAKITGLKGDGKIDFKDADKVSDWAKDYVDALSDNKIITGYEDNTFRPINKITRAESVVMMDRIEK